MRKPSLLERSLRGIVGGVIGGFMTFALAFSTWHWVTWTTIAIGVLVGFFRGDRGIRGLLRAARWTT